MDRGYRKGLKIEPDRKSRGTWLGLLIGSWLFLALLAWFDPFDIGRNGGQPAMRPPELELVTPRRGIGLPRGVSLSGDGYGARFAFGNVIAAPHRYGTEAQLMRSSFATGGPHSLTEAMAMPNGAFIGEVGGAVRVVALISDNYANWSPDERRVALDLPEPADTALRGPSEDRVVLANGCLRLGTGAGPLVVLASQANALFVDDAGWLTVGGLAGMQSLRVGEVGVIATDPLPVTKSTLPMANALRRQCGGKSDIVVVANVMRTPVCDLTPAQVAQNRAAMNANQRDVTDRMTAMRRDQIASCVASGRSEPECQRSVPPMPPPPIDLQQIPHNGRAPGEMCLAQSEVPAGAWSPDQPS